MAIVTTVVLVLAVAGVLGAIFRNSPEPEAPDDHGGRVRAAPGCPGHGRPADPARQVDRRKGKTYVATVTTNCGDIELTLDGEKAPQAVASFVELAKQNY